MSLNFIPSSNRIHIGIFGKRNAGKSSVVNAITGQPLSIVSDIKGTTTDPVLKAMEILPLGPVVIIDTPGLDDDGVLGKFRVEKALLVLNKTDIAILVVDSTLGITEEDNYILKKIKEKNIPFVIVYNKCDLITQEEMEELSKNHRNKIEKNSDDKNELHIFVSSLNNKNIKELKDMVATVIPSKLTEYPIIQDLVTEEDIVILVVPIDSSAPKGRLILPQQQTIRDLLEANSITLVIKETKLKETLNSLTKKPKLVVTDSQEFKKVSMDTPSDILLTSFSILYARHKGNLEILVKGAYKLDSLKDGDNILICEGCTHHRQCDDIGTVKLPNWIRNYTGKNFNFTFTSGVGFPENLDMYSLVIHCGGCTLNEKEVKHRIGKAFESGISITNYGTAIAHINGILDRSLEVFKK